MSYAADPGGIFASDAHRRVLASVPHPDQDPITFDELMGRLDQDPYVPVGTTQEEETLTLLEDLQKDGDIEKKDSGWQMTDAGSERIQAPPPSKDS